MKILNVNELVELVENGVGLEKGKLFKKDRNRTIVAARQIFVYYAMNLLKWRQRDIKEFLGQDHSTIHHAYDKALQLLSANDEFFVKFFDKITRQLYDQYGIGTITVSFQSKDQMDRFLVLFAKEGLTVKHYLTSESM